MKKFFVVFFLGLFMFNITTQPFGASTQNITPVPVRNESVESFDSSDSPFAVSETSTPDNSLSDEIEPNPNRINQPYVLFQNLTNGQIWSNGTHKTATITTKQTRILDENNSVVYYNLSKVSTDRYRIQSAYGRWIVDRTLGLSLCSMDWIPYWTSEQWYTLNQIGSVIEPTETEFIVYERNSDNISLLRTLSYGSNGNLRILYDWTEGFLKITTRLTVQVAGNYRIGLRIQGLDGFTKMDLVTYNSSGRYLDFSDMLAFIDESESSFVDGDLRLVSQSFPFAVGQSRELDPTSYETNDIDDFYIQINSGTYLKIITSEALPIGNYSGFTAFSARSLVRFNLDFIGLYSNIQSAYLNITQKSVFDSTINTNISALGFNNILSKPAETETIIAKDFFSDYYLDNGSNYNVTIRLGDQATPSGNQDYYFNHTDFVQDWISNSSRDNYISWQLRQCGDTEGIQEYFDIFDAQHPTGQAPTLSISWVEDTDVPFIDCELCRQETWEDDVSDVRLQMYDQPVSTGAGLNTSTLAYSLDSADWVPIDSTTVTEGFGACDYYEEKGDAVDFAEADTENITIVGGTLAVVAGELRIAPTVSETLVEVTVLNDLIDADHYYILEFDIYSAVADMSLEIRDVGFRSILVPSFVLPTVKTSYFFILPQAWIDAGNTTKEVVFQFREVGGNGIFEANNQVYLDNLVLRCGDYPSVSVDLSFLAQGSYDIAFRIADLNGNWAYSNMSSGESYYPKFTGDYAFYNATEQLGWSEEWTETTDGWAVFNDISNTIMLDSGIYDNSINIKLIDSNSDFYVRYIDSMDISDMSNFRLYTRANITTTIDSIDFVSSSGNYYRYNPDLEITDTWNQLTFELSLTTIIGSPDPTNIIYFQLRIRQSNVSLYFDGLHFESENGDSWTEDTTGGGVGTWVISGEDSSTLGVSTDSYIGYESIYSVVNNTDSIYYISFIPTNSIDLTNFNYLTFTHKENSTNVLLTRIEIFTTDGTATDNTFIASSLTFNDKVVPLSQFTGIYNLSSVTQIRWTIYDVELDLIALYIDNLYFYTNVSTLQYDYEAPVITDYSLNENLLNPWDHVAYNGSHIFYSNDQSMNTTISITGTATDAVGILNIISQESFGEANELLYSDPYPTSVTDTFYWFVEENDTATKITVLISDRAGNEANLTIECILDNDAPGDFEVTTLVTTFFSSDIPFTLNESVDTGAGLYIYIVVIDQYYMNLTTHGTYVFTGLAPGLYFVYAGSYDNVGNGKLASTNDVLYIQLDYDQNKNLQHVTNKDFEIDFFEEVRTFIRSNNTNMISILIMGITIAGFVYFLRWGLSK